MFVCGMRACGLGLLWGVILAPSLFAHAVLLEAKPEMNSTVEGPDVVVRLRFNSRIDGKRSRLTLVLPDRSARGLDIEKQDAPEILSSSVRGLASGAYRLRWQVLASDGHITRGEFLFQVK